MKIKICAYPVDWTEQEALAVPVIIDQIPPQGSLGRLDFRLKGLITGMLWEELFEKGESWLLINLAGKITQALLLEVAGQKNNLSLELLQNWCERAINKLLGAGAKKPSLAIDNLFHDFFPMKDFTGAVIKPLVKKLPAQVDIFTGKEKANGFFQETERWLHHFQLEKPVELELCWTPDFLSK